MDYKKREELFTNAKQWIFEAGNYIREKIHEPINIDSKSDPNDLVTSMDKLTERFFLEKIKTNYPNHLLLGEEGYGDQIQSLDGTIWIIDPIDGTMNFVHQKRNFAISIGIFHNGIGEIGLIYDVMSDILYSAKRGEGAYKNNERLKTLSNTVKLKRAIIGMNHYWLCPNNFINEEVMQTFINSVRGVRTTGSAALELAYVAEGVLDGYLSMELSPWDIAAGLVLINEVGGVMTDYKGDQIDLLQKNSVVSCNEQIQLEIINYLKKGKK